MSPPRTDSSRSPIVMPSSDLHDRIVKRVRSDLRKRWAPYLAAGILIALILGLVGSFWYFSLNPP